MTWYQLCIDFKNVGSAPDEILIHEEHCSHLHDVNARGTLWSEAQPTFELAMSKGKEIGEMFTKKSGCKAANCVKLAATH